MKISADAGGISSRWALLLAFGVLCACGLVLSFRSSGSVLLMHLGYSEQGNGARAAFFRLTNGTSKPIAYVGFTEGVPTRVVKVTMPSGWSDLGAGYTWCATCPEFHVLGPGQSAVLRANAPSIPSAWRAGVKYWHCKIRNGASALSGNRISGFGGYPGMLGINANPPPGSGIERELTLMQRLQPKLPKLAPTWLKRHVDSKARDPVVRGPEMN